MAKKKVVKKQPVSAVKNPKEEKTVEMPKQTEKVAPQASQAENKPIERVIKPTDRKVVWITVCFSNADKFKFAAKLVARVIADETVRGRVKTFNDAGKNVSEMEKTTMWKNVYNDAFRYPLLLTTTASRMTWTQIMQNAIAYESAIEADYTKEYATAQKNVIFEEAPIPEKPKAVVVEKVEFPPAQEKDPLEKDEYEKAGLKEDNEV